MPAFCCYTFVSHLRNFNRMKQPRMQPKIDLGWKIQDTAKWLFLQDLGYLLSFTDTLISINFVGSNTCFCYLHNVFIVGLTGINRMSSHYTDSTFLIDDYVVTKQNEWTIIILLLTVLKIAGSPQQHTFQPFPFHMIGPITDPAIICM